MEQQDIIEINDFLTSAECAYFCEMINKTDAGPFTCTGLFENKKWRDQPLANKFYDRLCETVNHKHDYLRAGDLIMSGQYVPGQSFSMHTDTGLFYDAAAGERSRWTLLVYLNDNYEGGETVFYDTATWAETRCIKPVQGKALIFDIDLWHCGMPLQNGKKSWIGCEIIGSFT